MPWNVAAATSRPSSRFGSAAPVTTAPTMAGLMASTVSKIGVLNGYQPVQQPFQLITVCCGSTIGCTGTIGWADETGSTTSNSNDTA